MEQTMVKGYDNIPVDYGMLLDLPFNEGSGVAGAVTRDIAKPHHQDVTLVGPPTWTNLPLSNIGVLDFSAGDYLECAAAATADLDFTGDYTILCWIYPVENGVSQIIMGRYALDTDGWEIYWGPLNYLTLRHHHVSLPEDRDGCYSEDWLPNTWHLMGISRSGLYPVHYRNGQPLEMFYGANGMRDPDSANRDLVIGTRFTKDTNWWIGMMKRPRATNWAFSAEDHRDIFEMERAFFGV